MPIQSTALRRNASLALAALAAVLLAIWLLVDPRTPDLAAQVYRANLFRDLGFTVWDEHWYGGHHLPAYSLLFPPLGALLGVRTVGVLAVLASTLLFERLLSLRYGAAARWGAAWFAVAAVGDVWAGRVTFALGVSVALAAALAFAHRRTAPAALLAALSAATSPIAAALLGLAALSVSISERSWRALAVLALPAAAVVIVLALLFPEGGYEPYPFASFIATVVVVGLFLWALPGAERTLRIGAWVYLLACAACLLIHTPVGSNIERYGVLLAGPLLLSALLAAPAPPSGRRIGAVAALALCAAAVWTLWGPVRETAAVAGSKATSASYYVPVERFLARDVHGPVRIEVPLTRSHWEAAWLAPHVSLARGWDKQLDDRYDHVLLASGLTASSYLRWLQAQAVAYVALPDAPLDPSSADEGRLIRGGLPYLRLVSASAHWRIYRVLGAQPLLSGPGVLTELGHDTFALRASRAGTFEVRVRYTRYFTLSHGHGCVARAPGGWTTVVLTAPGSARVAARFSLARALGLAHSCSTAAVS